ncbi:signal peptidase I [Ignisphaera sp. 4213-co]|uniref:Signal peptidase I n=1 Tax=Ignisphaera cupida TaxID=3050454 RepID=A0ABD4Z524_9CREN|nr:signal peptidase I [Ignisphaera sp. 4213-co]MDK6028417.1 signal peptidase I [Ignisphaera sp. 4213-co]
MTKMLKIVETAIVLLLIFLLLYANIAYYVWKQITIAVVEGYSMNPLLHDGDIVLILPANKINLGDIIVFKNDYNEYVIHRVVGIINCSGKNLYITKGDNNQFIDQVTFIAYRSSIECKKPSNIRILNNSNIYTKDIVQIIINSNRGIDNSRIVGKVLQINGIVVKISGLITR